MITLYLNWYRSVMTKRAVMLAAGLATVALALAGCGDSVHAGGENAAIHPSSAIWVSPARSARKTSPATSVPPIPPSEPFPATPPTAVPAGPGRHGDPIQTVVNGGCWQNAGLGNVYGAYDQHFWWMGDCGDTTAQVAVELYPTAADCHRQRSSSEPDVPARPLPGRQRAGRRVLERPPNVLSQLATVKGLAPVPGYGGLEGR